MEEIALLADPEHLGTIRSTIIATSRFTNQDFANTPLLEMLLQQVVLMRLHRYTRADGGFDSIPDLLLRHGHLFTKAPDDHMPDALRGAMQQCFYNSVMAAAARPDRLVYCEGIAFSGIIPVDHAWVLDLETGMAWDPTWSEKHMGPRMQSTCYVGLPFRLELVLERAERGNWCMLDDWHEHWPILSGTLPLDEALDARGIDSLMKNPGMEP